VLLRRVKDHTAAQGATAWAAVIFRYRPNYRRLQDG
jgi:hypothetical protein